MAKTRKPATEEVKETLRLSTLIIKLGSIITHYEELNSPGGHPMDQTAIDSLMANADVVECFENMRKAGFLPTKR